MYFSRQRKLIKVAKIILMFNIVFSLIFAWLTYQILSYNFQLYYVATGSMEPNVPMYSIVLVQRTFGWDYGVGDVVKYSYVTSNGRVEVLHRIIGIEYDEVKTKGDAASNYELIHRSNVTGKLVFGIPWLGVIHAILVREPIFLVAVIIITATIVVLLL